MRFLRQIKVQLVFKRLRGRPNAMRSEENRPGGVYEPGKVMAGIGIV